MGTITVLNKHQLKCDPVDAIYIGRGSPLGNPYTVNQYGRDPCIEMYKRWLEYQISVGTPAVVNELDRIAYQVMDQGEAKLLCFCKPKACHGDHIAKIVLDKIKEQTAQQRAERRATAVVCSCGRGHRSAYDGKCGHCRTRKEREEHRRLIEQPTVSPERLIYAGIGSRKTPLDICEVMSSIAEQLAPKWILWSGFADRADQAFFNGATKGGGASLNYLPWQGFNRAPVNDPRFITPEMSQELINLAAEHHPWWDKLSDGVKKLHARNGCQILGLDLQTPVKMVICWTEHGAGGGGTGQALRIARAKNIPIFDLALDETPAKLMQFVENMEAA